MYALNVKLQNVDMSTKALYTLNISLVIFISKFRSWGSSHDGESVQVVKVEKVPSGSVAKQGKKAGLGKPQEPSTSKSVVFTPLGQGL